MRIEILNNLEAIRNLKAEWDELFLKAKPCIFASHTWIYENYRCFDTQHILLIAVFGDKNKLIGVFPFAIEPFRIKWFNFRALVHGGSKVTDYSCFLIDPEANSRVMIMRTLEKLIELQPSLWDFCRIDNLSDGDDVANLFKNLMLNALHAATNSGAVTPIIQFNRGHHQPKKIASIKRQFRRIHDESDLQHFTGKDITRELMDSFGKLHQQSFPNSTFDNPQSQSFYRNLIDSPDFRSHVQLSFIQHNGTIIAAHFGFKDENKFYYYVPTYDTSFAAYGPGQFLLWKLISRANENSISEFDFLRGLEDYKIRWANKINTNFSVLGVTRDASRLKKLLVNLWPLT